MSYFLCPPDEGGQKKDPKEVLALGMAGGSQGKRKRRWGSQEVAPAIVTWEEGAASLNSRQWDYLNTAVKV